MGSEQDIDKDVIIIDDEEEKRTPSRRTFKGLKEILDSGARSRTKKLLEKAMLIQRKRKKKAVRVLNPEFDLNDADDFRDAPKLRSGRAILKLKVNETDTNIGRGDALRSARGIVPKASSSRGKTQSKASGDSKGQEVKNIQEEAVEEEEGHSSVADDGNRTDQDECVEKTCPMCHSKVESENWERHLVTCLRSNFSKGSDHNNSDSSSECITCQMCNKDITHLNFQRRLQHTNRCLDQKTDEENSEEEHLHRLQMARTAVLGCPMCGKGLKTEMSRKSHLKKCTAVNKMTVEQVKNLVTQQREEHIAKLDAGILSEEFGLKKIAQRSKKTGAKLTVKPKSSFEEDTQLALALSTSMVQDEKSQGLELLGTVSTGQRGALGDQEKAKGKKKKGTESNILFHLTKEELSSRMSEKVALYMFSKDQNHKIEDTPPFKKKSTFSVSASDSGVSSVWQKTSLNTSSSEGSSCSSAASFLPTPQSTEFYAPELMPPVRMNSVVVGSKLKRVSTIPGRQLSQGPNPDVYEGEQHERELSSPLISQTVNILAQLVEEGDEINEQLDTSTEDLEIFHCTDSTSQPDDGTDTDAVAEHGTSPERLGCSVGSHTQGLPLGCETGNEQLEHHSRTRTELRSSESEHHTSGVEPNVTCNEDTIEAMSTFKNSLGLQDSTDGELCQLQPNFPELSDAYAALVNCCTLSDVTILTKQGPVRAHKVIFCARCPSLLLMSTSQKGEDVIDLSESSHSAVLGVLNYIYSGQIAFPPSSSAEIIHLAERFSLHKLADVAIEADKMRNERNKENSAHLWEECSDQSFMQDPEAIPSNSDTIFLSNEFVSEREPNCCKEFNPRLKDKIRVGNTESPQSRKSEVEKYIPLSHNIRSIQIDFVREDLASRSGVNDTFTQCKTSGPSNSDPRVPVFEKEFVGTKDDASRACMLAGTGNNSVGLTASVQSPGLLSRDTANQQNTCSATMAYRSVIPVCSVSLNQSEVSHDSAQPPIGTLNQNALKIGRFMRDESALVVAQSLSTSSPTVTLTTKTLMSPGNIPSAGATIKSGSSGLEASLSEDIGNTTTLCWSKSGTPKRKKRKVTQKEFKTYLQKIASSGKQCSSIDLSDEDIARMCIKVEKDIGGNCDGDHLYIPTVFDTAYSKDSDIEITSADIKMARRKTRSPRKKRFSPNSLCSHLQLTCEASPAVLPETSPMKKNVFNSTVKDSSPTSDSNTRAISSTCSVVAPGVLHPNFLPPVTLNKQLSSSSEEPLSSSFDLFDCDGDVSGKPTASCGNTVTGISTAPNPICSAGEYSAKGTTTAPSAEESWSIHTSRKRESTKSTKELLLRFVKDRSHDLDSRTGCKNTIEETSSSKPDGLPGRGDPPIVAVTMQQSRCHLSSPLSRVDPHSLWNSTPLLCKSTEDNSISVGKNVPAAMSSSKLHDLLDMTQNASSPISPAENVSADVISESYLDKRHDSVFCSSQANYEAKSFTVIKRGSTISEILCDQANSMTSACPALVLTNPTTLVQHYTPEKSMQLSDDHTPPKTGLCTSPLGGLLEKSTLQEKAVLLPNHSPDTRILEAFYYTPLKNRPLHTLQRGMQGEHSPSETGVICEQHLQNNARTLQRADLCMVKSPQEARNSETRQLVEKSSTGTFGKGGQVPLQVGSAERQATPKRKEITGKLSEVQLQALSEVPLMQRLGLKNPFVPSIKVPVTTTNDIQRKSDSSEDMAVQVFPNVVQGADKVLEENSTHTPKHQGHIKARTGGQKLWTEPSPFTPMAPYDDMTTPELKNAVTKIGVRPVGKKRMRELLKSVYHQTHQYETDSDYEATPVKRPLRDSDRHGTELVVPTDSGESHSTTDHLKTRGIEIQLGLSKKNEVKKTQGQKECSTTNYVAKGMMHESNIPTQNGIHLEGNTQACDLGEDEESQDSSYSDGPDMPEESLLQGWPEDETDAIEATQSNAEAVMIKLREFLIDKQDIYEKILTFEPLELDVLKKRISESGIRIGLQKVMDFLDDQCITFTMKNMTSRFGKQQPRKPDRPRNFKAKGK